MARSGSEHHSFEPCAWTVVLDGRMIGRKNGLRGRWVGYGNEFGDGD